MRSEAHTESAGPKVGCRETLGACRRNAPTPNLGGTKRIGRIEIVDPEPDARSHSSSQCRQTHYSDTLLAFAKADDWLDLLAFPAKALDWTEDDEDRLRTALQNYEQDGARDERYDCSTVDELAGLRESLGKLREYGLDLEYQIG